MADIGNIEVIVQDIEVSVLVPEQYIVNTVILNGPKGDTGTGFNLKGTLANVGDLPTDAQEGDAYIVGIAGIGYVWDGTQWIETGPIRGPQGPQGIPGVKGNKGDKGDTGSQGIQGPIGLTGATGPKGVTGEQGIQGEIGPEGPEGPQGPIGLKGDDGDQGPQGIPGVKGDTGATGSKGDKGDTGTSAYQAAVAGGFVGTEAAWIASLKGVKGDTGEKGDTGSQGIQGPIGNTGPTGPGFTTAVVDVSGHLILTKTDTTTVDTGSVIGPQGPKGDTGNTGTTGNTGPGFTTATINSTGHLIITKTDASTVDVGLAQGSKILTGAGVPSNALGLDGDQYFRSNGEIWNKAAGVWAFVKNLTGATGSGIAAGGTTGQLLAKTSATDYATSWIDIPVPSRIQNTVNNGYVQIDQTTGDIQFTGRKLNFAGSDDITFSSQSAVQTFAGSAQFTATSTIGFISSAGSISLSPTVGDINFYSSAAYSYSFPKSRGTSGQVLTSNGAGVLSWATPVSVPSGGTTGQVLTKNSGTNFDASWVTPAVPNRIEQPGNSSNAIEFQSTSLVAATSGNVFISGANLNLTGSTKASIIGNASSGVAVEIQSGSTGGTVDIKTFSNGNIRLIPGTASFVQIGTGGSSFTLPAARGTNGQVLTSNGAGATSWTSVSGAGGGTVTEVTSSTNRITVATGTSTPVLTLNEGNIVLANLSGNLPAARVTGLATVATTGAYSDLTGTPTIPAAQVNSDWNAVSGVAQILNKPTLTNGTVTSVTSADSKITVATGTSTPVLTLNEGNLTLANLAGNLASTRITGLSTVATSGSYADLSAKPTFLAPRVKTVTYSANTTLDWSDADVIRVTLTGNVTFSNTGAVDGQKCSLEVSQDATGARTVAFAAGTVFGTDITAYVPTATGSKTDMIGFVRSGSNYRVVAVAKGY